MFFDGVNLVSFDERNSRINVINPMDFSRNSSTEIVRDDGERQLFYGRRGADVYGDSIWLAQHWNIYSINRFSGVVTKVIEGFDSYDWTGVAFEDDFLWSIYYLSGQFKLAKLYFYDILNE